MHRGEPPAGSVIFFDLLGTLVSKRQNGFTLRAEAAAWLGLGYRLGVLCNAGKGRKARDVQRILEEAGIYDRFSPDLVVVASDLPCPLPDRRAFAVVAALAETPVERCVYVSADPALLAAAATAGMHPVNVLAQSPVASDAGTISFGASTEEVGTLRPASGLLASEIDEDRGPTFVLRGRIVTMNEQKEVLENAQLVVQRGKIAAVVPSHGALPAEFSSAVKLDTQGTIYPGLIDLHNHFVYNVLPLWKVPKRYLNRSQWPREEEYITEVSRPVKLLAKYTETSRALVRYVEAKALVGGTTTGQGIRTRVEGGVRLFRGAMRNVEETDDPRLPEAGTNVRDLGRRPEDIESFREALRKRVAYFYHLAEGVDQVARGTFTHLLENDLIHSSLVGIHSLGLGSDGLKILADRGAKLVWSPFSNLLLYGRTLDLATLRESGALFCIGCDWSPTGSKNLLQELKVARYVANEQGAGFTSEDLIRAVTFDAARAVGWHQHVGVLKRGALADLLVVKGTDGDPYEHLINATEPHVVLVTTHGTVRYGDHTLMHELHSEPDHPLEDYSVAGVEKAFNFYAPSSELNSLTFTEARKLLQNALVDLPAFREEMEQKDARLNALGLLDTQPFTVELDNEYSPAADELIGALTDVHLLVEEDEIASSIDLDLPEVNSPGYWERIDAQANIDDRLREVLKNSYAKEDLTQ